MKSTFLRADVIDDGDLYTTARKSLYPLVNANNHTLTFGIEVIDSLTRDPVPLTRIVELRISNDPQFDPRSTYTIENWPSLSHSSALDYFADLDSEYFLFGDSNTPPALSTSAGTGLFHVRNWPLSATGGLSTVYFSLTVLANSEFATYPEGYDIFDQIFWQTELPSIPGVPELVTPTEGYVGRRAFYQFRAAEEGATGLYNTGVSRYLGSIVEVRRKDTGLPLLSTAGDATSGLSRTLAAATAADPTPLTVQGYDFTWSSNTISSILANNGLDVDSNIALSTTEGAMLYANESLDLTDQDSPYAIDFAAQAAVSLALGTSSVDATYWASIVGVSDFATPGSSEEIVCRIDIPAADPPTATLYTIANGDESAAQQSTTLPEHVRPLLLSGGVLEMYLQALADTQAQGSSYVQFCFTPTDSYESYILASTLVPLMTSAALQNVTAAVGAAVEGGGGTFRCEEIVVASGKVSLDVDLGDCFNDDGGSAFYPSTNTIATLWSDALDDDWIVYTENTVLEPSAQAGWLQFDNGPVATYQEIQAVKPSMSDRIRVSWSMRHGSDEFYIAISPEPVSEVSPTLNRPMGTRINPEASHTSDSVYAPTIYVGFSELANQIFISQRLADNTLLTQVLRTYSTSNNQENYSLTVSSRGPTGSEDGVWVVLRRNNDVFGMVRLQTHMMPSASDGLGWYVAAGVRGDGFGGSGNHTDLYTLRVDALPLVVSPDAQDPVSVRHFLKANGGAAYIKPFLGQQMLYGATDFKDYERRHPKASGTLITVEAATAGENYEVVEWDGATFQLQGVATLDGYSLVASDRVLVKDQDDPTQNGIYEVIGGNVWELVDLRDELGGDFVHQEIFVANGDINEGAYWYVDDYKASCEAYAAGFTDLRFVSRMWLQRIQISNMSPFFGSLDLGLLEIKLQPADSTDFPGDALVRFYEDDDGSVGLPLTDWESMEGGSYNSIFTYRFDTSVSVSAGDKIWVAVMPPMDTCLGTANASSNVPCGDPATGAHGGWIIVNDLWMKLFARYSARVDNTANSALQQCRVRADSHARLAGHASSLSPAAVVDIEPPSRPGVQQVHEHTVRTARLNIESTDSLSGIAAFRIGKETNYGVVSYTPWQSWSQFFARPNTVEYVTYLYGTWPITPRGSWNRLLLGQNAGSIGPRKVWAQVMDGVGNISESYPLTLLAQGIGLVDTTPPSGGLQFVSGTSGAQVSITNQSNLWLKTAAADAVTGAKDVRIRALSGGTQDWSDWVPYREYLQYALGSGESDGLKRLEIQVRDYGNNIQQAESLWDVLYRASDRGVLFTRCLRWQPALDGFAESVYLTGIREQVFTDYALVDSQNPSFTGYTAFYALSQDSESLGRRVYFRASDDLEVRVNDVVVTSWSIDSATGLLVFDSAPSTSATLEVSVTRHSAVLYRWDGSTMIRLADMGMFGERAVLSMAATNNYLFLGCSTGNIYAFDGRLVEGPVLTVTDDSAGLPVTALATHRFMHEAEDYLYAATSGTPRLWRALARTAFSGTAWTRVAQQGFLNGSSGGVRAFCGAYNKLFLATDSGAILRYERAPNALDPETIDETLTSTSIPSQYLGEDESDTPVVSSLLASGTQVFAGLGDRPEIWNYTEEIRNNPERPEDWATIVHDESFINDPAPAQFYYSGTSNTYTFSYTSVTTSRLRDESSSDFVTMAHQITDPNTESGFRNILLMVGKANKASFFEHGAGSDWEQVMNNIAPSAQAQPVYVATTGPITLSGLPQTIDGVTISDSSVRVLVKDQADASENGIYVTAEGSWSRAADMDADTEVESKVGVQVENGVVNGGKLWVLQTANNRIDLSELYFARPSWTLEFEAQHLKDSDTDSANAGAQGLLVADGHHLMEITLSPTSIRVQSGSEYEQASFLAPSDFSVFSRGSSNLVYPEAGVKRIWGFEENTQEDQGPYWIGTGNTAFNNSSLIDWRATYSVVGTTVAGVPNVAGIGKTEAENNTASFTKVTHFMQVQPTNAGDPRIINPNVLTPEGDPVVADAGTQLMVRLRITPRNNGNLIGTMVRMSWASGTDQFHTWIEKPIVLSADFVTYVFEPSWDGPIEALALEISGLPTDNTRPLTFDIDYVAVVSKYAYSGIRDNLTPIRVAVEGRDVKVWVGKNDKPLIDAPDLLSLPTEQKFLRFGKINPAASASFWGWGNFRFLSGATYAPITRKVYDWRLSWRFPSAGAVQTLIMHNGTAYALTDGVDPILIGDNPDDRQLKVFAYQPALEVWSSEAGAPLRETDGTGLIRPFDAVSYDGSLLVLGQRANIRAPEL